MSDALKTVGLGMCWEELDVGFRFQTIGRTITEADLVAFINCTGMVEVLFTDVEYANTHSPMQGRVVPGALAYTMAEGLLVQSTMQHTGLAFLHMEFNVLGPTFVGDTIHVEVEVLESRATSKGRGLVRTMNHIVNQHGKSVIDYNPLRIVAGIERRDGTAHS